MKKLSMIALTFVLAAGILTGCRAPVSNEGTTNGTVAPTQATTATTPSTQATTPSTQATTPTTEATQPGTDATRDTGDTDTGSTSATDSTAEGRARRLPGM